MPRHRLIWRIYPALLGVTLVSLAAVTWLATSSLRSFYLQELRSELAARALVIERLVEKRVADGDHASLQRLCRELRELDGAATRITIVDLNGRVLADSDEDPATMDLHADRPEIVSAMSGDMGQSLRYSSTLRVDMLYLAVPLNDGEHALGAVRTARSLLAVNSALRAVYLRIALGGILIAAVAVGISLALTRIVTRPLADMRAVADMFSRGDLNTRVPDFDTDEFNSLGHTMNEMAAQLDERIATVIRQRNQVSAILSCMAEGVIALDADRRILQINAAANRILGLSDETVAGRTIQACVRNTALHQLTEEALRETSLVRGEVVVYDHEDVPRYVQVQGTALLDAEGRRVGAVLVLNDLTHLRRLESVRRDFVANVSHEIRTPVTSIKGFVETLLDGAMAEPEDAARFLDIILKQTERLNALIEDLLLLSRVEQDEEGNAIRFIENSICDVVNSAVEFCRPAAAERNVILVLHCPDDVTLRLNAILLEQAVSNLVDNAIKYSHEGGTVEISVSPGVEDAGECSISVRDFGAGIPREHLPRLFERFYRVDKGRSREQGGTGLGLAIVKHVVQAHGGRVTVESRVGKGSVFTIHLPLRTPPAQVPA
jgi:two-component system phosphate regulon sensor histidine kinase PhoR